MRETGSWRPRLRWCAGDWALPLLVAACLLLGHPSLQAQSAGWSSGPAWQELTDDQRVALGPLEKEWPRIDGQQRLKWMALLARFDRMSPEERLRTQQRMTEWVRLSPKQRNEARLNFQDARQLSTQERQERWEAYKALPEEQRSRLTNQAKANSAPKANLLRPESKAAGPKVNTVSNPFLDVGKPHPAAPGAMQAKPGATTLPIAARPAPPLHQQPGLPKVVATPEFVDSTTLLPQRGAQGAAAEPRRK